MTAAARPEGRASTTVAPPLPPHSAILGPLTYGYLFSPDIDELQLAVDRKEIEWFCASRDYALTETFCDRGAFADDLTRVGLTALLDVLALPHSEAQVVVPDWSHLSEPRNHRTCWTSSCTPTTVVSGSTFSG